MKSGNRKVCGLVGSRGNCRGDECEASIYSKAYTERSDPFELRQIFFAWGGGTMSHPPVLRIEANDGAM